jgi:hypothetical protein
LSSEIVDVRIASVKTFKKGIYGSIDGVLAGKKGGISTAIALVKVASTILECTEVETKRIKPHIPTVRRLSRCFLEIFDGYCTLEGREIDGFVVATQSKPDSIWRAANAMIEHEGFLSDSGLRPHGETFLAGNAAELMAIQFAADAVDEALVEDRTRVFASTVCRLNNMHASWRSRFSAVKAIGSSGLLSSSQHELAPVRNELLLEILKMLQDSDPDVRRCAAQAATQIETLPTQETGRIVRSSLPSPTLRRLYPAAYGLGSDNGRDSVETTRLLLQIITDNTKDLSENTSSLGKELDHSREVDDPWKIANASTSREIFEEEDPNSSDERLLSSQLAVLTLLGTDKGKNVFDDLASCPGFGLVEILRNTLENLAERKCSGGIVHDMSRFPSIFPSLHALLVTVAALTYSGILTAFDTKEVIQLCEGLLGSSVVLHPEVSSALNCLSIARCGDAATKEMIRKCLFLL